MIDRLRGHVRSGINERALSLMTILAGILRSPEVRQGGSRPQT